MRQSIAKYFLFNSHIFKKDHGETVKSLTGRDNYDQESVVAYAKHIRSPNTWGGDLEIHVASVMLDVVIHRFDVVDDSKDFSSALLMASFFPNDHVKGLPGPETLSFTKWSIVWRNYHFLYATPRKPRGLTDASEGARRLATESINHMRAMKNRTPKGNSMLAQLAKERHERERLKKYLVDHTCDQDGRKGPSCPPGDPIVKLTTHQEDEAKSVELVRQIMAEERQKEEDRLLAVALSETCY